MRCEAPESTPLLGWESKAQKVSAHPRLFGSLCHGRAGPQHYQRYRGQKGKIKFPCISNKTPSLNCDGNSLSDRPPWGLDGLRAARSLQIESFENTRYSSNKMAKQSRQQGWKGQESKPIHKELSLELAISCFIYISLSMKLC